MAEEDKSKDRDDFDVYTKLLKSRTLFLTSEIDADMASDLIARIIYLDELSHTKEIKLYINSPGGATDGFFAIYDIMQQVSAPIKTICIGEACSSAAVVLAGGSSGKRFASSHSLIMIHNLQISDLSGSMTELTNQMSMLAKLNTNFTELLARHTGQPLTKIRKDCAQDMYLSADEALEYGIVDKILPPKKKQIPLKAKKTTK